MNHLLGLTGCITGMAYLQVFGWPQLFHIAIAPSATPPLRWHSRTPSAISWAWNEFEFSVPLLESKAELYRMKVKLERMERESWDGCAINDITVADAGARPLARWSVMGGSVYGRESWTSDLLRFRASAEARKFLVRLRFGGSHRFGECGDLIVPVGFR